MKGLADESTRKLIFDELQDDKVKVPRRLWCSYYNNPSIPDCCFWHFLGMPERDEIKHPMYEYEQIIADNLERFRTIAIYKATGLGITEFMIVWILWKCMIDPWFKGKEAMVITAPNVDIAQELIKRTKDKIRDKIDYVDHGVYGLSINGCDIFCYPSNNIDAARGKPRVSIFFGDEAAFFKLRDDNEARTVGERYIGKSNAYVIWVSTAGKEPKGFLWDILREPDIEHGGTYKKLEFYYEWGLKQDPISKTSIYTPSYIEQAKKSRSFEQEYMGIWGKNVGDIFNSEALEKTCSEDFSVVPSDDSYDRVLTADPGYGSSKFGIVVGQKLNKMPYVIYASQFERSSGSQMVKKIDDIAKVFHVRKIRVDSSRPELIKDLRLLGYDVVGYNFRQFGKEMTENASEQVDRFLVRINPAFKELKSQLMTIKYDTNGMPDKDIKGNSFDLGDAFLMMLWYYKHGGGTLKITY